MLMWSLHARPTARCICSPDDRFLVLREKNARSLLAHRLPIGYRSLGLVAQLKLPADVEMRQRCILGRVAAEAAAAEHEVRAVGDQGEERDVERSHHEVQVQVHPLDSGRIARRLTETRIRSAYRSAAAGSAKWMMRASVQDESHIRAQYSWRALPSPQLPRRSWCNASVSADGGA